MTIDLQDLKAAVGRGILTEQQAADLTALSAARRQAVEATEPGEEPFVLFKGFNEIFIVIGLSILYFGWVAVTALLGWNLRGGLGMDTVLTALVTLGGLALLSRYFTLTRRMIAPSIALAIMAALTAGALGWAMADLAGVSDASLRGVVAWGTVGVIMATHYQVFRVPFDAALVACAAFACLWSVLGAVGIAPEGEATLLRIMGSGSIAWLSVVFGLGLFALAMRFDMSDPLRISTRSTTGFWLHVVAAPMIVNTIALNLMTMSGLAPQFLLLGFLVLIAMVAIIIDRRSFLVSGAGYAVWLAMTLFDGSALVIVFLGLGLVLLGAQWERLRRSLMVALPDFQGKTRLPPYTGAA